MPDLVPEIMRLQFSDPKLLKIKEKVLNGESTDFLVIGGILYFKSRLCVPRDESLQCRLFHELHHGKFSIHLEGTKMYHDIMHDYWWKGMKRDISKFVSRCLVC